ncbi:LacI family DNA-binding transcriptional regulator [Catenovulum sp. 2E275]|uniref:LacI family DNA-binding transcriptional regulator n=1 Tax=Catenovulum sp. 2E275 TaxID=2980497 RepID=UPI0021D192A3|nr:LacI family DNA-binding transcriptional regulator [Catenovulum sp. 2E275]MCU4677018.1 LacI family DNA-binding transcriptional regulator [Catenovulum sp. 2E275]
MVTIKQVAELAGVSFKTVSRVVNKEPGVKPANIVKVEKAIQQLGYRPNKAASLVRKKQSDIIGFISDEISTTPASVAILKGAQDMAWEKGKTLMVFNLDPNNPDKDKLYEECLQHRAEGIIYGAMYHQAVSFSKLFKTLPTVLVNCISTDNDFPAIVPDDEQAGYYITKQLLYKGYRKIAFLNLNPQIIAAKQRQQGYIKALNEYGIAEQNRHISAIETVINGETINIASKVAKQVISEFKPDAVLCGKDLAAIKVYFVIERLGLTVGKDIGVASFDNWHDIPEILEPGLSTMALPYYEMGRLAVSRLLSEIKKPGDISEYKMPCLLCDRASF